MKTANNNATKNLTRIATKVLALVLAITLALGCLVLTAAYAESQTEPDAETQTTLEVQTSNDIEPDTLDPDAYADWLIALDDQYILDNFGVLSDGRSEQSYVDTILQSFDGDTYKAAVILKATLLLQRVTDQLREPTAKEKSYVAFMQMLVFGEASPYYSGTGEAGNSDISTLSGGGDYHYIGPRIGTYPAAAAPSTARTTFRKGLILVTDDPAGGIFPTGHAAILFSALNDTAVTSFPKFASRNDPQQEGVQTEPNDWWDSHATCFVLKSDVTTATQDAAIADWCNQQYGKQYNFLFYDVAARNSFYCSQLVWAGFLELYGINLNTSEPALDFGTPAIHPMELVHTNQTSTLYRHGTTDTGWQTVNGQQYYISSAGNAYTGLVYIGSDRYYFNSSGIMQTGWQLINGNTYYFNPITGIMQTGWVAIGSEHYYFDSSGVMQPDYSWQGSVPDSGSFVLGNSTATIEQGQQIELFSFIMATVDPSDATGWHFDFGVADSNSAGGYGSSDGFVDIDKHTGILTGFAETYEASIVYVFLTPENASQVNLSNPCFTPLYVQEIAITVIPATDGGSVYTGWVVIDNDMYYYNSTGTMQTGLQIINGNTYYFNPTTGTMQTGWQTINGARYYFNPSNGVMQTGWQTINSNRYCFDSSGKMLTGMQLLNWLGGTDWFFMGTINDGSVHKGWWGTFSSSNPNNATVSWYYLDPVTGVRSNGFKEINGRCYYFGSVDDGVMKEGWQTVNGISYYLRPCVGTWTQDASGWHYSTSTAFSPMLFGQQTIGGVSYQLPYSVPIKVNGFQQTFAGVLSYNAVAHVQNVGNITYSNNYGATALGTTGQQLRIESLVLNVNNPTIITGGIRYQVHVQDIGDQGWRSGGQLAGTQGQSRRIEAITIEMTGNLANNYDVYYRSHVQNIGWTGWAKNGYWCGSSGHSYRMEALQIVVVAKTGTPPGVPGASPCYYY